MSNLVKATCAIFGVKRNHTTSYHPACNATCEQIDSQINRALHTYVNPDQDDWPSILPGILMAFRNSAPADNSTKFSPHFILFCANMRTPLDVAIQGHIPDVTPYYGSNLKTFTDNKQLSRHNAREYVEQYLEINKTCHDNNVTTHTYHVGDYVWLFNPHVPVGHSTKWRQKWWGPYTSSEVHDNSTHRIRHLQTQLESPTLINGACLKPVHLHNKSAIHQYCIEQQLQQRIPAIPDRNYCQNIKEDEADDLNLENPGPARPIEKILDLCSNHKGKWYKVKLQGLKGCKWVQHGFFDIPPQQLLEECLKHRTC